jgi:hypothetical protein
MHSSYRKQLIEVALPLDAINKESAREKSTRHGHPSMLHLWWTSIYAEGAEIYFFTTKSPTRKNNG